MLVADADWRCDWCECNSDQSGGHYTGPKGPGTICRKCSRDHRAGVDKQDAMKEWKCHFCNCTLKGQKSKKKNKRKGPSGPLTLCVQCGTDFMNSEKARIHKQDKALNPSQMDQTWEIRFEELKK